MWIATLRRRFKLLAVLTLYAGIIGLVAGTVLAELGQSWWIADLFAHFRYHYGLIALALAAVALLVGRRGLGAVAACLIVPQVWAIAAPPRTPVEIPAASDTKLRVMSINVLWSNRRYDAVVKLVERENPDIVALQEVSRDWHMVIERLAPRYPHVAPADWRSMRSDNVILSRHAIRDSSVVEPPNQDRFRGFTHVDATIDAPGGPIRVLGVHPPLPNGPVFTAIRQAHLDYYARVAARIETPLLIVGDFNITPYSPRFRAMLDAGRLRYVHLGWSWPRSWPSESYGTVQRYVRGFPIDHILTSRHFAVAAARAMENVGSDHYPVAAELLLRR